MRSPIRDLAHNLMWTVDGTCWATWRIKPMAYGHRPVKEKQDVANWHRLLVRALQGEALMLGVTVSLDPAGVVERMLRDTEGRIDGTSVPQWVAEARATLNLLSLDPDPFEDEEDDEEVVDNGLRGVDLGRRVHYLAVPLSNPGKQAWIRPMQAGEAYIKEQLALPRAHPSKQEVRRRLQQAERIGRHIPSVFAARPVTVTEQVWLAAHHQSRGLMDIPPETAEEIGELVTTNGCVLPEPVLDPGASSDDLSRVVNPFTRRVLKVWNPAVPDQPASYQALMVLTATPTGGLTFPGSELLSRLDEYAQDTDWAIRIRINSRDKTMRLNRRAVRTINDQFDQRRDEAGEVQGLHELEQASSLIREYQALFASDRLEVEVEHTVVLATGATDYDSVEEQARQLQSTLGGSDFQFDQPIGAAEDLWWSMHPGVPTSQTVRSYAQFTSSSKFARLVPFISTQVGGSFGPLIALNISSMLRDVIHLDPSGYPELDISGSIAASGELGSGKSTFGKTLCAHIVSKGGQLIAVDKDQNGEWASFARALDPEAVVVDTINPQWSMDPLRITETLEQGSTTAQAFYLTLLNLDPSAAEYSTLERALQADYLRAHGISSSLQLMHHLGSSECTLPGAAEVAGKLEAKASSIFGPLIFDEDLEPVPSTANIVWRANEFQQPTRDEMVYAHQFAQMGTRKTFGRAYYRLMMACARTWAFADTSRATVFVNDEAYDMYSNPENVVDGEYFARQGRRYKAMLLVLSHNPDDFGSDRMREIIKTRLAFRHTDDDASRASVRFLGVAEDDPEFEAMVATMKTDMSPTNLDHGTPEHRRGECFIRDAAGTIGDAKILLPARAKLRKAVLTTPPKSKTVGAL